MRRIAPLAAALCLLGGVSGCTSKPRAAQIDIAAGRYGEAFDATQETLRRAGFTLERVDARAGVMTTRPKSSAGLAEPWERDDSRFGQRVESLLHHQRRRVIVTFEPAGATEEGQPARREAFEEGVGDLRAHEGPLTVRMEVRVDRIGRPGLQVPTTSVRLRNQSVDPLGEGADRANIVVEEVDVDPWLAGRLARKLARRLEGSIPE